MLEVDNDFFCAGATMRIAVRGTSTIEVFPERAQAHVEVEFVGYNKRETQEHVSDTVRSVVDYLTGLEKIDPSPITWKAVLPFQGVAVSWQHFSLSNVGHKMIPLL